MIKFNKQTILILIVVILIGYLFLYPWFGPINIKKFKTWDEQINYQKNLEGYLIQLQLNSLAFWSPKQIQIKRKLIASMEYSLVAFSKYFENNPKDMLAALDDIAWGYQEDAEDYKKALFYQDKSYLFWTKHKNLYTPTENEAINLGNRLTYAQLYKKLKQYQKAVELYETIPRDFKYQDRSQYDDNNLWSDAYQQISNIYAYRLKDYEKAIEYAKKIAIDPRHLTKDKIGQLKEKSLIKLAGTNLSNSEHQMYYIARDMGKHKEAQQILINGLKSGEKINGHIFNIESFFKYLISERKLHGKLVEYKPKGISIYDRTLNPPRSVVIPYEQYIKEQKKLYEEGKESNWPWL